MILQKIIEQHWYKKINLGLFIILLPLWFIFVIISTSRKIFYQLGILKSYSLPVPVVIIGNISVGGVGKTPLTKFIALQLIKEGTNVGVILRGYKSTNSQATVVSVDSKSNTVGDEALIYAQNNIPVAIGINRYLAGKKLLETYPNIQIILTDDGLQHYQLKRNYEIVVIDKTRMFGNSFVLPLGPLREPISRLKSINSIVINGNYPNLEQFKQKYHIPNNILVENQIITLKGFFNPVTRQRVSASYFINKHTASVVAIGNPQRFFDFLRTHEIKLSKTFVFPDHYYYESHDIPNNYDAILVTEKDYTKLTSLNNDKIWVVEIDIVLISNQLIKQIAELKND